MRRYQHGKGRSSARKLAGHVRELAIPVPFDLDEFRGWLERSSERRVRLIPAIMEPGAPSGIFLRRAEADYLYYERRTSAFHQAHIVLCLAAHILFGEGTGPAIDLRLVPDVSPQLVRLMLGQLTDSTMARDEAEAFAFLVLDQGRPVRPWISVRRDLRQLRPLHAALRGAVPETTGTAVPGVRPTARFRLHRQVIEIRDAALALRPYRDPQVASAATTAAQAAGLAGDELAAAVEAAVLGSAVRVRAARRPARRAAGDSTSLPVPKSNSDLRGEAAWLVQVSRAFTRLPRSPGPVPGGRPGSQVKDKGQAAGTERARLL